MWVSYICYMFHINHRRPSTFWQTGHPLHLDSVSSLYHLKVTYCLRLYFRLFYIKFFNSGSTLCIPYLMYLFIDLHCLYRRFNSIWIFSPLWYLWCLITSTSFYCSWMTAQHGALSSCRFEYHAAAEVIKVVEFEEVDGMFNVDITQYSWYGLTLGYLLDYLEQVNALLLWVN